MKATYIISKKEIRRRIIAFTSLVVFWLSSLVGLSFLLPNQVRTELLVFTLLIAIFLFTLFGSMVRFFKTRYLLNYVELDGHLLKRFTPTKTYMLNLKNAQKIVIKYTTRQTIRQVSIYEKNGVVSRFDGLEDFESMIRKISALKLSAKITRQYEKIDYDHVLFYPILGTLLGIFCACFIWRFSIANSSSTLVINLVIFIYCLAMAMFILVTQPFASQYGKKLKKLDYISSFALFIVTIVFAYLTFA